MGVPINKTFGRLLGGAALLATGAAAQDAGGLLARFEVAPGLRYSTDTAGNGSFSAVTDLGFDLSSQTRASVFDLSYNTSLVLASEDDSAVGLGDPDLRLSYARESRDTAVSTSLRYRETDLGEALIPFATDAGTLPELEDDFLRLDAGTRTDLNANVGLEFGRTAPFGGTLSYSYDRTDYEDTLDPDLRDSETGRLAGSLRFRLDDRITATVSGFREDRDVADGGVDRERWGGDLGVDLAIDPRTSASVALGYSEVTLQEDGETTVREGTTFDASVERALPNGTISASLASDINDTGRRTSVRVGRALDLSETTGLSFDIGFSQQDGFGIDPVVGLNLSRDLRRGTLNASLSQSYTTDNDGETVRDTSANLSWNRTLTRTAGLRSSLSVRDREALAEGGTDLTRVDLSVAYNQALTDDWNAVASYSRSFARENGAEDTSSDAIFVGLNRVFSWRP